MEPNTEDPNGMSQEEARAGILEFVNHMVALKNQAEQYRPVLKTLEQLGISVTMQEVSLDGVPTKCIVFPAEELVKREYEAITGFNPDNYIVPAMPPVPDITSMPPRTPEQYNYEAVQDNGA